MAEIQSIGVIGAGQMGNGIAQVSGMSGYKTLLWDASNEALEKGYKNITRQIQKMASKGKIESDDAEKFLANITCCSSLSDFKDCDMTVEAIVEHTETKLKLFAELDEMMPADSILATNTSSISITKIAAATKRPEKVMGVHFMNPVPIMKLVELIRGLQTSDETYQAVEDVVAKMGKTAVQGIDSPGFCS